jgi:N-acetylmuramoyl-L-alanine amidase
MLGHSSARPAPEIEWRQSPNFDDRGGAEIDMLVLHYTGMPTQEGALAWLCSPQSRVSSHYFVFENGRIVQSVAERDRAWHAGASVWRGATNINARSIGIEIANPGHEYDYRPFPSEQIEAVIALCALIVSRHAIPARNLVAHSDIAPTRKQDPGELFPWSRLSEAGLGLFVEPTRDRTGVALSTGSQGPEVQQLQQSLAAYGYGVPQSGEYDELTRQVVAAFQRHFRPARVDGVADQATRDTLKRLLGALGPGEGAGS